MKFFVSLLSAFAATVFVVSSAQGDQGPKDVRIIEQPIGVDVANTPDVNVVGTPGVTVENLNTDPVPVDGTVDLAVERVPFQWVSGYGNNTVGFRSCVHSFYVPERRVIETVSIRGYGTVAGVEAYGWITVITDSQSAQYFLPLFPMGNTSAGTVFGTTQSLRLYPDAGTQVELAFFGEGVDDCDLVASGYKAPNTNSLSP